jgi:aspartate/methionine/tyrosine aminotransferase
MKAQDLSIQELKSQLDTLNVKYKKYQAMGMHMDISRGLPSPEQLDLNRKMFHILDNSDCISEEGADIRNYGVRYGLVECRRLFSELLGLPIDNIIIGGNSSFNLIYDAFCRAYCFGVLGEEPWCKQEGLKFLCPVPGYDCHFSITELFGFEMINIPMTPEGPDMDLVEKLAASDPKIKGIWCVPLYSNPNGYCYSDECVRRFAKMKTAAPDFQIFWDNAYCVHHLYKKHKLLNLYHESEKYGTTDRILYFASTAKITYPGACVSIIASGDRNIAEIKKRLQYQIFSFDKINQMRHVKYLKSPENIEKHMEDVAVLLRPKFDYVDETLRHDIPYEDLLTWFKPDGGYFITVDTYKGCAKRTLQLMEDAGVMAAKPGATFPYHKDPNDTNIRLAPTHFSLDVLKQTIPLFCICVQIAGMEKILAEKEHA